MVWHDVAQATFFEVAFVFLRGGGDTSVLVMVRKRSVENNKGAHHAGRLLRLLQGAVLVEQRHNNQLHKHSDT